MASGSAGSIYVDLLLRDTGFQQGLRRANSNSRQAFGAITHESRKARSALAQTLNPISNISASLGILGATVASALSVQKIIQYSDTWRQLEGRLRIVETDMQAVGTAQEALFEIAQRNRSPLDNVINFYQRLNQFIPEAIRGQYDLLSVTEGVTAALAITGENSMSANAAMIQLSQAVGTNFEAAGQELRSIQEQAPRLAQAITNALGGGSKSLQQLVEDGILTRDTFLRVFDGVSEESKRLAEEMAKIPLTVGQAFTRLDNAFLKFIGQSELVDQGANSIAASISSLAENLETVASVFSTAGVLIGSRFVGPVLEKYGKLLASETQYQRAVSQGRLVTLDSLEAVKLKAFAELEASRKGVSAVEARIAALKKEQAQIIAMRSEYARTSPASLAGAVNNPSVVASTISAQNGLYAAQNKLTRDLALNKALLATEEAALASTTTATSLALTRYNAAALAASLSTRVLAASSRLASGALALVGGPVGATVVALYAGVKILGHFSSELRTAANASDALNKISTESNKLSQEYVTATKERREQIRGEIGDLIANAQARLIALNALNMENQGNFTWEYIKGNWLGLSDDIDETANAAINATKELGRLQELLKNLGKIGSTSTEMTKKQRQEAEKLAKELQSLYEKNERYIQGLSKEQYDYNRQIEEFNRLWQQGKISYEQYYDAVSFYQEELAGKTKSTFLDMEAISKRAAENMQDAFADFLFNPFEDGLKGMLRSFVETMQKMLAEQLSSSLFRQIAGSALGSFGSALFSGGFNNAGQAGLPWQSFGNVNPQGGVYAGNFGGFFADGGFLKPGEWGIAGEQGAEMIYGGRTGATVIPNGGNGKPGNTYNIDARGADEGAVRRLEAALMSLAGPGQIEKRVSNAQRRGAL